MVMHTRPEAIPEGFDPLFAQMERLDHRFSLAKTVTPNYYEPGLMENLEQSYGAYDPETGVILLRFESMGTRYEGRIENIEKISPGDSICILRDPGNPYNCNNFTMTDAAGHNVGHMPRALCDALAPVYDSGAATVAYAKVSYVEPLSRRGRYARQPILYVEMQLTLDLCADLSAASALPEPADIDIPVLSIDFLPSIEDLSPIDLPEPCEEPAPVLPAETPVEAEAPEEITIPDVSEAPEELTIPDVSEAPEAALPPAPAEAPQEPPLPAEEPIPAPADVPEEPSFDIPAFAPAPPSDPAPARQGSNPFAYDPDSPQEPEPAGFFGKMKKMIKRFFG